MRLDELLSHYAESISTLLSTVSDRALERVPDCLKAPSFLVACEDPTGRVLIQVFSVKAQSTLTINGVKHRFQASRGPLIVSYSADRSLEAILFPDAPQDATPVIDVNAERASFLRVGFANHDYAAKYWGDIDWNALTLDTDAVIPFKIGPKASFLGVDLLYGYEIGGERREQPIEYIKAFGTSAMLPRTHSAVRDEAFMDFFTTTMNPYELRPSWSFSKFLRSFKEPLENAVLLLGSYREEKIYDQLKQVLSSFGYTGFLLRDAFDLTVQTNMAKFLAGIICSNFIIVVDDIPSGHIAELVKLLGLRLCPTIIVRREGSPATYFLEDSIALDDLFKVYDQSDLSPTALAPLISWARSKMRDRVLKLNQINNKWRDEGVL